MFNIFRQIFNHCAGIMAIQFTVSGLTFTLWDVFVIAALMSGAGLILAAGMGEE